jgi:hypothetical protein
MFRENSKEMKISVIISVLYEWQNYTLPGTNLIQPG